MSRKRKGVSKRILAAVLSTAMVATTIPAMSITAGAEAVEGNIELSRQIAADGMVLLENNNSALPLPKGETVAMFGRAMIDYTRGGGGSGATNVDYTRNILQGMQMKAEEGKISLYQPLVDFYTEQVSTNGIKDDAQINVTDEMLDAAAQEAGTAIVTVGRYSSEGSDRSEADYYLTDAEKELITRVGAKFDKVVVVLNVGAVMDTSWIKEIDGIDSVLVGWQAGMEGGLATADILVGDVNPSGKLVDTWAKSYNDYPSSETFNESSNYVNYTEDIFVGYRYFETFDPNYEKVNYPFGYGLSYTDFEISDVDISFDGDTTDGTANVTATVKNTGDVAGKEVVQVYFSAPQMGKNEGDPKLGKPAKELAAFDKTDLLDPGESETLEMSFKISDMSSYDDTGVTGHKSAYVMEAGNYDIYVGNCIKDAGEQGVRDTYTLDETIVTEQLSEKLAPVQLPKRLLADGTYQEIETPPAFDPHHTIKAEGQTVVQSEAFIDGDVSIENFYNDDFERMSCIAMMNAAGKFVEYEVTVETAGTYKVTMRYANGNADLSNCFKVSVDGELQPGINFNAPQTGDGNGKSEWYNFADAEPFYVNLPEGKHILRFEANGNNPNYDYMVFEKSEEEISYYKPVSATESTKIEAESYDFSGGSDSANYVRTENFTVGEESGVCVAYMNHVDNWISYYLDVEEAGKYDLTFHVANGYASFDWNVGADINDKPVEKDIIRVNTTSVDGNQWYNFVDVGPISITLPEGECVLTFTCSEKDKYPNIDYFTFEKHTETEIPDEPFEKVISSTVSTQIEAEDYDNTGSTSDTPVREESFTVNGEDGTCLAYMNYAGNWVSYNLYVEQAGDYNLMFNVANGREGFDWNVGVEVGDTVVENDILTVPQTGDGDGEGEWYNFEDVGPVTVALEEGNNIVTLRCSETNKYPNIDYITFNKADTASASTPMRARALAANVSNADPAEKIMLLDVYEGRATMDDFLAQITNEQLIDMMGGQPNTGVANTGGMGNLMEYGIPNIMTADGPQGVRIGVNCTAWPIGTLQACTWDVDLVEKVGKAAAVEAHNNGIDIWLAPGMNIHRDPLCGRNFEYYSEDPLLAGKMAASLTTGCQSEGVAISLKHFAANNKETNRSSSDSRVSERALREIYLKGFEIAVKEADPWTIMSSYNLINGVETAESEELLTDILRGEWGYEGLVETDWGNNSNHAFELKAGNDVKMPTGSPETLKNAFEKGFITRDELLRSAERLMNLVMKVNTFHDKIADPITVDIGADTTFKAAENILWSETVKAEGTSDEDGGKNLGYCDAGAWAEYRINVGTTGKYNLSARISSQAGAGAFDVLVDGKKVATFEAVNTGAWQNWTTLPAQEIQLEAGEHTLKLAWTESGSNLNWLKFELIDAPAAEHTLTVSYPTTVKLSIDGEEQTIANLTGAYKDVVMANTNLDLTFEPRAEGREIAGVTVNGEPVEAFDVNEYVYSLAMPNADTTIELGFTIVDKENLREVITIAESENVKAQVEAAVPSVQKKYKEALQAAKAIEEKKTASQDEINNAMFELIEALQYLSFAAGDKSQLEIPMEIAKQINRENFTPESVQALDDAYKAAEDLMDDEEVLEADIQAAAEALYEALDNLVFRADRTDLEALVAEGKKIVENASKYIQDETWATFKTILGDAETLLENANATQEAVDEKAEELLNAITALRMIPNKDALKDLIGKAEAVNTSKYTAKSVAAMQKALSNAKVVLNNEAATEEEVKSAVEALEASIQNLETKTTTAKKSGSTSRNVSNTYGAAGVVSASQSAVASVRSDAANAITLNRGSVYTFKMTVVNGNGLAPSFTVGNGSVLKTQFVSQIGNDYYYRVYAVGTPGQSTGVYTTLPGQNAKLHCTVTIG